VKSLYKFEESVPQKLK